MNHIRPHQIFSLVDPSPAERIVSVPISKYRGGGGLTLLETFIVLAACRAVNARRVFEFGTYRGSTTLCLALNLPDDGAVFTFDLADPHASTNLLPSDEPVMREHFARVSALDFSGMPVAKKITTLTGESTVYDFASLAGSFDLVFVDGGHDLPTLSADTKNAFRLLRPGVSACVIWHDYGSPMFAPLTEYLDALSQEKPLYHVEETMLCLWFSDSLIEERLQA